MKKLPALKVLIFLFLCLIWLAACKKKQTDINLENFDYVIFGTYSDSCTGDCVTYYKIEQNQLFADNIFSGTNVITFSNQALSQEKYNDADNVLEQFPTYLRDHPNQKFGCPDCDGQGAYLLRIKQDGKEITWHFDKNNSANPEVIRDYVLRISTAIRLLGQ